MHPTDSKLKESLAIKLTPTANMNQDITKPIEHTNFPYTFDSQKQISFNELFLENRLSLTSDFVIKPVPHLLDIFEMEGTVIGLAVSISDRSKTLTEQYITGAEAYQFTVLITSPQGKQAQVIVIIVH